MRKKGSTLLITLMIVMIMMSVSVGAASISFLNLGNSISYADAQIARDAAEAGVNDLIMRLNSAEFIKNPTSTLVNIDSGVSTPTVKAKKPPFSRFYSFTPEAKIKQLGRCTKVAVISAWDTSDGKYLENAEVPNWDMFFKVNKKLNDPNFTTGRPGIEGFAHPLTNLNPADNQPYTPTDFKYWQVKMGGPLDQWDPNRSLLELPQSDPRYTGLFSKKGFLNYDLLYFPLPPNRVLRLDDDTREHLESWLKLGGKLWIDAPSSGGLMNGPFSENVAVSADPATKTKSFENRDYRFNWDYSENREDNNLLRPYSVDLPDPRQDYDPANPLKAIYDMKDTDNPAYTLLDDTWVMDDAFNKSANIDPSGDGWKKVQVSGDEQAIQGIGKPYSFNARVIRPAPVQATSYPGSMYWGDSKAADRAGAGNVIYIKYGRVEGLAIGDTINLIGVKADGSTNTISRAGGSEFTISDTSKSEENPDKWIKVAQTPNINELTDKIGLRIKHTTNGNLAIPSVQGTISTGSTLSPSSVSDSTFNIANTRGFAIGDIIELNANGTNTTGGPLWGKIETIDRSGPVTAILRGGPTPRQGHVLVQGKNGSEVYLFGGSDLSTISRTSPNPSVTFCDKIISNGSQGDGLHESCNSSDPKITTQMSPDTRNDVWKLYKSGTEWKWKLLIADQDPTDYNQAPIRRAFASADYDQANDRLIIVGGEPYKISWAEPNNNHYPMADVWAVNQISTAPAWQNLIGLGKSVNPYTVPMQKQEILAHSAPSLRYYSADNPGLILKNDVQTVTLVTNPDNPNDRLLNYPRGVTIGDEVRFYRRDTENKEYVLEGKISNIIDRGIDDGRKVRRFQVTFEKQLVGSSIEFPKTPANPPYYPYYTLESKRHMDMPISSKPADAGMGGGASVGDLVSYSGNAQGKNYWGYINNINPTLGIKEFTGLFTGPYPRTRLGAVYSKKDSALYTFGGQTLPEYAPGKKLGDTWKFSNTNGVWDWQYLSNNSAGIQKNFTATISTTEPVNLYGPATVVNYCGSIIGSDGNPICYRDRNARIKIPYGSETGIAVGDKLRINGITYVLDNGNWKRDTKGPLDGIIKEIKKETDGLLIIFNGYLSPDTTTIKAEGAGARYDGWYVEKIADAPNVTRLFTGKTGSDTWNESYFASHNVISVNDVKYPEPKDGVFTGLAVGDVVTLTEDIGEKNSIYLRIEGIDYASSSLTVRYISSGIMKLGGFSMVLDEPTGVARQDMLVFGGSPSDYGWQKKADVMKGSISNGAVQWKKIQSTSWIPNGAGDSGPPNERTIASAAFDQANNKMLVYGGTRDEWGRYKFDSTWRYDLTYSNNVTTNGTWQRYSQKPLVNKWDCDGPNIPLGPCLSFGDNNIGGQTFDYQKWTAGRGYTWPDGRSATGMAKTGANSVVMFGGVSVPPMHTLHNSNLDLVNNFSGYPTNRNQEVSETRKWVLTNGYSGGAGNAEDGTFLNLKNPFFADIYDRWYPDGPAARAPYNRYMLAYSQKQKGPDSGRNVIPALNIGLNTANPAPGILNLGEKFVPLVTYPDYPRSSNKNNNMNEDVYGTSSKYCQDNEGTNNCTVFGTEIPQLISSAVAKIGEGTLLLTSNNVGGGVSSMSNRYDPDESMDTDSSSFIFNAISYYQTRDQIKVNGFYGGIARAFLVNYSKSEKKNAQYDGGQGRAGVSPSSLKLSAFDVGAGAGINAHEIMVIDK